MRDGLPHRGALPPRRHDLRTRPPPRPTCFPDRRAGEQDMPLLRLATVWLGGCSGCHMSFLDLDEFLFDLAARADIVFSPFIDAKEYPEGVDVALVEGAVANEEHLATIRLVRRRTKMLISFGDCAVTG